MQNPFVLCRLFDKQEKGSKGANFNNARPVTDLEEAASDLAAVSASPASEVQEEIQRVLNPVDCEPLSSLILSCNKPVVSLEEAGSELAEADSYLNISYPEDKYDGINFDDVAYAECNQISDNVFAAKNQMAGVTTSEVRN